MDSNDIFEQLNKEIDQQQAYNVAVTGSVPQMGESLYTDSIYQMSESPYSGDSFHVDSAPMEGMSYQTDSAPMVGMTYQSDSVPMMGMNYQAETMTFDGMTSQADMGPIGGVSSQADGMSIGGEAFQTGAVSVGEVVSKKNANPLKKEKTLKKEIVKKETEKKEKTHRERIHREKTNNKSNKNEKSREERPKRDKAKGGSSGNVSITGLFTKHHKLISYVHYFTMILCAFVILLVSPGLKKYSKDADGTNLVSVYVNGELVGTVDDTSGIDQIVISARKRLAKENSGIVLAKADVVLRGSSEIFGSITSDEDIENNIYDILCKNAVQTKESAYEVKINKYTVNLKTADEVLSLLRAAKDMYDTENIYGVNLVLDPTRELDVLTTEMIRNDEISEDSDDDTDTEVFALAGMSQKFKQIYEEANEYEAVGFNLGIKSIDFNENIEVVKTYVDSEDISTLEDAIAEVTKEQEKSKVYVVESGDTIGVVAEKNNLTIDQLIAMNSDKITNEASMIHPGDELNVTAPEPELSVLKTEEVYYEEYYDAEVQYVDNDDWYTNEQKTLQQPTEGFRKVIADVTYKNNEKIGTEIVYEDVVAEAIPKIVERGTKTPPTYIYPLSGRVSSTFGKRKAPKKGASTYHKGIDFAVSTGTPVRASCGGVVTRAGWGSGYGYCVYIKHPDGKETRYGHCSKVLVKVGQNVKQGDKIALSGNTGVSTGPHLHFEILVGGVQVNPFKYLQ